MKKKFKFKKSKILLFIVFLMNTNPIMHQGVAPFFFPLIYFPLNFTAISGSLYFFKKSQQFFDKKFKNSSREMSKKLNFKLDVLKPALKISGAYLLYNILKWNLGRLYTYEKDKKIYSNFLKEDVNVIKRIDIKEMKKISNYDSKNPVENRSSWLKKKDYYDIYVHGTKMSSASGFENYFLGLRNLHLLPKKYNDSYLKEKGSTINFEWPSENLSHGQREQSGKILSEELIKFYVKEYLEVEKGKKIILHGHSHGSNVVINAVFEIDKSKKLTEEQKKIFFENLIIGLEAPPLESFMMKKIIKIMEKYSTNIIIFNSVEDETATIDPYLSSNVFHVGDPINFFSSYSFFSFFEKLVENKKIKSNIYIFFNSDDHCKFDNKTPLYFEMFIKNEINYKKYFNQHEKNEKISFTFVEK